MKYSVTSGGRIGYRFPLFNAATYTESMQGQRPNKPDSPVETRPRKPIAGFAAGPAGDAIWLDGKQPLTVCPNCHGAMPLRVWLSIAECPSCGTSVRLTADQEQQALTLLRQPVADKAVEEPAGLVSPIVIPQPQPASSPGSSDIAWRRSPSTLAAASPSPSARAISPPSTSAGTLLSAEGVSPLPAWVPSSERVLLCGLVSALIHMLLVLLLGVWLIEKERRDGILLAATISDHAGDETVEQLDVETGDSLAETDVAVADIVAPSPMTSNEQELVASLTSVEQPAGELLPPADVGKLPVGQLSPGQVLAGRDPAFRGELVAREGGTTASEAAVARALRWLENHQASDGSWSLDHFSATGDCNGRCGGPGIDSDTSATALALLPFLGAGQTHIRGDHTSTVARGLRALMDMQHANGDLRGRGGGNMYAHGQATIALCEAYAMTQSDILRDPAQRAVDYIVAAQHEAGGWRYAPREPGDLSVVGWQMMALRSAQMAYLKVPAETFLKATQFLNSVQQSRAHGLYCYMPGGGPTPVMTAEGLLCRQYAGWRHNHPVLLNGVHWLASNHSPRSNRPNMYFWYYGTQVMHHMGGKLWTDWNAALRDLLISLQAVSGHEAGSWPPLGGHDSQGGRVYTTALAACTLEVYYRHLPLYRGAATGGGQQPRKATSPP